MAIATVLVAAIAVFVLSADGIDAINRFIDSLASVAAVRVVVSTLLDPSPLFLIFVVLGTISGWEIAELARMVHASRKVTQ